jgi:hypothetical protein
MANVKVGFQLVGDGGVGNIDCLDLGLVIYKRRHCGCCQPHKHRLLGWAAQGLPSKTSPSLELLLLSPIRLVQRFWLHIIGLDR